MLTGGKVRLRPFSREDVDGWLRWLNDPGVTRNLYSQMIYGVTLEYEVEFYENMRKSRNDVVFTIETLDGEQVGIIGLHKINWEWRNAEMGIIIGEKDKWGKGYCTDALKLIIQFAFERMNLHRVYLVVNSGNIGGIKCYEKAGFKREGTLRENRYYDGKYSDDVVMGILKGEQA